MMPYYRIDDVVYVNNNKLSAFGEVGVIRNYYRSLTGKVTYVVHFSSLEKTINLSETNLSPYSDPLHKDKDSRKDMCDKLAYIYYHDEDNNPSTVEDAMRYHDLEEVSHVVYGSKEEIIEKIEDGEHLSYKHGFIIMNGELYHINKTVSVDW